MNSVQPVPAGWYGKLSSLGDFASRRLEPEWIEACDDWLSACVAASRRQLGDRWLDTYLSAPVWRFAWAPDVVDHQWWFGVLMPSCDNVGRYFPLLVAQPRSHAPVDRTGLDHLEVWWRHVARTAMQTLHDHSSVQTFEAELAEAPPWPAEVSPGAAMSRPEDGYWRFQLGASSGLVDMMAHWGSKLMLDRLHGCSIWWPMVDVGESSTMTVSPGLPAAERFSDLLSGRW